ncbi:unnamed protein product [Protopolystoma xenopodis]|uniref:Uncharacterized protein n=1 Tax=Protopolystoma xenopodis TaxID=117903 RepID=A0A448WQZ1_9PLAT|nr:unnamed protein product [Protopolystoma xenopodis]
MSELTTVIQSADKTQYHLSPSKIRFHGARPLIDIAGQSQYRKKWIHFFEGVHAILFLASLSDYCEVSQEKDGNTMWETKGQEA